ncbi:MAG: hypothetical protein ABR503_13720 [Chitinophagaceae bacterium]|nr:hypothetical protein [Chitinophagaceae bacterium]
MTNYNRELLVMLKANSFSDKAFEQHVECLHNILIRLERNDVFCKAHELVTRVRITQKNRAILKAITTTHLKPFYFLINKN